MVDKRNDAEFERNLEILLYAIDVVSVLADFGLVEMRGIGMTDNGRAKVKKMKESGNIPTEKELLHAIKYLYDRGVIVGLTDSDTISDFIEGIK